VPNNTAIIANRLKHAAFVFMNGLWFVVELAQTGSRQHPCRLFAHHGQKTYSSANSRATTNWPVSLAKS
jgi:cytolysin (calcineurin-like family phosphatase)